LWLPSPSLDANIVINLDIKTASGENREMADVPSRVVELIETFDRNIEAYRSQQYNETQLRREFIDPFFEELGWDVTNKAGYAQAYKDVIHEDSIKIGGYTKAPDYSFRIGCTRKFFLEAKKPAVDIKDDCEPAYQLRRYAWSAKLPLSVLTDFEEFAVYDCLVKPKHTDRASVARIMYLTYEEYADRWEEIAAIFSKDAVLKGSFDRFAAAAKGKRGTTPVDIAFLDEIEKWRKGFAQTIAHNNRSLTKHEINFAVQRTIDRILFLRMCEDRGIEQYKQLDSLTNGNRVYLRLCELFVRADKKYNSGLFHFQPEKDRAEPPDELTLNLAVDDPILKLTLSNLYYPQCPYEFYVIPPEILGNVYEQFLGRVITVSPSRRVSIDEKPEVKKAGGVYYTPSYVVDYIVKNTVGKLCEKKTPKEMARLKILDPACGSGSFLLGAYTYLLDYHRDWYIANDPSKYTKQIYQLKTDHWHLTIAEKKKILINNIFGVDIDSQAVEVTKLSLLLKVLEGESKETVGQTYKIFHERALPDLGNNIKCGNSLIGPDFYDDKEPDSINEDLRRKINAFDWHAEFPQIFSRKNPGFDTVIGNPPYLAFYSKQSVKKEYDLEYKYLTEHSDFLREFPTRRINSVMYFLKRGIELLSTHGILGLIVDMSIHEDGYRGIRKFTFDHTYPLKIIPYVSAFAKVSSSQSILIASRETTTDSSRQTEIIDGDDFSNFFVVTRAQLISENEYNFQYNPLSPLFKKVESVPNDLLKNISTTSRGMVVSKDFILPKPVHPDCHKCVFGTNIGRYSLAYPTSEQTSGLRGRGPFVIHSKDFEEKINLQFKKQGRNTINVIGRKDRFLEPKLFVRYTPTYDRVEAVYDDEGYFSDHTLSLVNSIQRYDMRYVLGIINSKLIGFYALNSRLIKAEIGKIPQFPTRKLGELPIRTIDFDNPTDVKKHDKMVKLVERMLDLHKRLAKAKVPAEKTRFQRQITTTDKQIDKLVYELYNLTDEEIAIIEGKT